MQHVHSPNCGCMQYIGAEDANDLIGAIDIDKIRCLNEESTNSGKHVFKIFDHRFDKTKFVASDSDPQLLFIVPFSSQVKIRSIAVIAKGQSKYPNKMRLYINNQSVDFSLTEQTPVQQFIIPPNLNGQIQNAVKITKFSSVYKLIIHLLNEHEDKIQVSYIQIKGQNSNIKRQAVQTVYELRPNTKKIEMKDLQKNLFQME